MNLQRAEGKNRRGAIRRFTKRSTKAACFRGSMGLGPNLALSVLDVSETGARLVVKVPFTLGEEVEINLLGMGHRRPLKVPGVVVWCTPADENAFSVGVQFAKTLRYRDLLDMT